MTGAVVKRQLAELFALYRLEPTLRDVYVEGPEDKTFLEIVLRQCGVDDSVNVYWVDTIDLPDSNAVGGCRGRVIALSQAVAQNFGEDTRVFTGWVDADFDRFLDRGIQSRLLLRTDFTCTEAYFWKATPVERLLQWCSQCTEGDATRLREWIEHHTKELFLIRAAREHAEWNFSWISPRKSIQIDKAKEKFNLDEFVDKLLLAAGLLDRKKDFESFIAALRSKVGEFRHSMHGHDAIELLMYGLRGRGAKHNHTAEGIVTALAMAADLVEISSLPQMSNLLTRVRV